MQHAIVVATNDELPQSLHLEKFRDRPWPLSSNIDNPAIKYLLVLGRDSDELKLAADALVLGQATLSGQTALSTVSSTKSVAPLTMRQAG
ncbi:MAG: cellulose biosynthesis cyclic di-GMP-binding regulatory protein BcsB [Betaproteobacteria bacterium]|nr:cellulose biosynthesis cyclic di-GMP-binding regulatory protein BcsB [Betaproteobacteria bacterium]